MADSKRRVETIENRWDILYRDYPEVYDEFAGVPYDPPMIEVLHGLFDFRGKKVVDIGSGSGRSTFPIAAYAEHVIGVEPEASMRKIAEEKAKKQGVNNVSFVDGYAEDIPLDTGSVDMVVAITATMYPPEKEIPRFVEEAARVVRGGGAVVSVDVAPGWYGGELAHIIDDPDADPERQTKHRLFVDEHGFSYMDVDQVSMYGSTEKILGTYGFIFGRKAIEHLRKSGQTSITWRFRVYQKRIEK